MTIVTMQDNKNSYLAQLDQVNRRIWVHDYSFDQPSDTYHYLIDLATKHGLEKIIFPVRKKDLAELKGVGFVEEGIIEGYFYGLDAHFLATYTSKARGVSDRLAEEQELLGEILARPQGGNPSIPKGFKLREATIEDTEPMSILFSKVFSSYPTPVFDPLYLARAISKGDLYMVIYDGEVLAGVAAAEIDWDYKRAELTNCATHPDYRKSGLNTILLENIQHGCQAKQIHCLYSLARATSYGMNLVLHRLGYEFRGTLINNCHIAGGYEDMNIWVRSTIKES